MPFVLGVERSLTPRPNADAAACNTMHIFLRQTAQRLRTRVDCVEIIDSEVQSLGCWMGLARGGDVHNLQRHRAAVEIPPRTGLLSANYSEQLAVKLSRLIEVAHFDVDPKQTRDI